MSVPPPEESEGGLRRDVGFWGGTAIMVGIIVGSGIFRTPADIADQLGRPVLIVAAWAFGGLLALAGAFAWAELATMYPKSGGVYVYLERGLGRPIAFAYGWTYMLVGKPLSAAAIAKVFAEHWNALLGTAWNETAMTSALLVLLTVVNTFGIRLGAQIASVLTTLKIGALIAIVALALGVGGLVAPEAAPPPRPVWLAIAPVLAGVLWTYDGWSDFGAITGEVRDPARTVPRVLVAGVGVVTALYVAVNLVYLAVVPLTEMRTVETVAPLVAERLVGARSADVVTAVVLVSTLGATHASIITGARITWAQAHDGLLFGFLAHVNPVWRTPDASLWFQALLGCIAVWWLESFEKLAGGFVFTIWIFYGLAAVALIVLRFTDPDRPRPFRCPGTPVLPGLFALVAAGITVLSVVESPIGTLPWVAVILAAVPAYYGWRAVWPTGSEGAP